MENNTNTNAQKQDKIAKFLTPSNRFWLAFTHILMTLCAISLVWQFVLTIVDDDEWDLFLYILAASVGTLIICAIIQLLVKIEENTRK
ncbi:MAG: hypothetical protein IJV22_04605 [Bacteroidales bacterium]|nr:hypothetical protein [Bacteroidales bacterium]